MRSGKKLSALAIPIVAISLSLAANSAARTLSVRGNHQPTPLSQVKFLQRRLAAAPGPGQARLHARFAERENNGPVKRLAIDPALKFISTFGAAATIYAIAVDQAGNSYIGGTTEAQGFTTTPGAFQETSPTGGGGSFVAMIDPSGALVYSTYLTGSSGADFIYGMAVDSAGDAYVTGWAVSSDFPIVNAFQPTLAGDADAFVAELNPTGSALIYSSYLGGANVVKFSDIGQVGTGIAVDATGSAYVIGHTNASDFPTTPGAFQPAFGGGTCGTPTQPAPCSDAFITKVAPGGSSLVYSTFLGGSNYDLGYGIAVDSTGNAYVAGATASFDFPTIEHMHECLHGGARPERLGAGLLDVPRWLLR
jgi:hypothetical protein